MPKDESLTPKQMDEAESRVQAHEEEMRRLRLAAELREQQNSQQAISVSSTLLPEGVRLHAGRLLAAGFARAGETYVMTPAQLSKANLSRDDFSFLMATGVPFLNPPRGAVHSYAMDRDGNLAFSLNVDLRP